MCHFFLSYMIQWKINRQRCLHDKPKSPLSKAGPFPHKTSRPLTSLWILPPPTPPLPPLQLKVFFASHFLPNGYLKLPFWVKSSQVDKRKSLVSLAIIISKKTIKNFLAISSPFFISKCTNFSLYIVNVSTAMFSECLLRTSHCTGAGEWEVSKVLCWRTVKPTASQHIGRLCH